jgi:hypothetical protein
VIKGNLKQITEKFGVIGRPAIFTIILGAAAAVNGYASAAAFILPPDNGLQSARFCDFTDSGCGIFAKGSLTMSTGPTADSLQGQPFLESLNAAADAVPGDADQKAGDLAVSGSEGAPPVPTPEPVSSVLIGFGLVGLGSLTRRRRRASE